MRDATVCEAYGLFDVLHDFSLGPLGKVLRPVLVSQNPTYDTIHAIPSMEILCVIKLFARISVLFKGLLSATDLPRSLLSLK